jgi:hypothetical protein
MSATHAIAVAANSPMNLRSTITILLLVPRYLAPCSGPHMLAVTLDVQGKEIHPTCTRSYDCVAGPPRTFAVTWYDLRFLASLSFLFLALPL